MSEKYREFWVYERTKDKVSNIVVHYRQDFENIDKEYHVIEIQALTDLQKQVDEANEILEKYKDDSYKEVREYEVKYLKLQQQIADYEKALEFYSVGWVRKHARIDEYGVPRDVWKNNPVIQDAGKTANEVLAKYRGES